MKENMNDAFGSATKTERKRLHQIVVTDLDLLHLIGLLETGYFDSPLYNYLSYRLHSQQPEITTSSKQTYLDAPTIQSMLAGLREDAQGTEVKINYAKRKVNRFWSSSLGRGSCTTESFTDLNFWRDDLRKERKHLANLVKQIKGLKAMLKDAV